MKRKKRSSKNERSKRERVNRPFSFRSLLIKAHQQLSREQKILVDETHVILVNSSLHENKTPKTKHFMVETLFTLDKLFSVNYLINLTVVLTCIFFEA